MTMQTNTAMHQGTTGAQAGEAGTRPLFSAVLVAVQSGIVLGLLSLVGGYLLIVNGGVQHWLEPSVGKSGEVGVHTVSPTVLTILTLLVVGTIGFFYTRWKNRITLPAA